MTTQPLTQQRLIELMTYSPTEGLVWRYSRRGLQSGTRAGTTNRGKRRIRVDGHIYDEYS
jgi:hypothetical protein